MTSQHFTIQQTFALAGLVQAVGLIGQCAWRGRVDNDLALQSCLNSLLVFNAEDAESVYTDRSHLEFGLKSLRSLLSRVPNLANAESARYVANILFLERLAHQQPQTLDTIGQRLSQIREHYPQNALSDPPQLREFAQIYSDQISPLGPKLMIKGEPGCLKDADNAARIRALLLAGVRAGALWRHWGGNRLRMIVFRGRYRRCTHQLLQTISSTEPNPSR